MDLSTTTNHEQNSRKRRNHHHQRHHKNREMNMEHRTICSTMGSQFVDISRQWIIEPALLAYLPKPMINALDFVNKSDKLTLHCFDLDGTIIKNISRARNYSVSPDDWQWLNNKVVETLRSICENKQNGIIVIFTNQGTMITTKNCRHIESPSLTKFKIKITNVLMSLKISNLLLYGAPGPSSLQKKENLLFADRVNLENPFTMNRKPYLGMWNRCLADLGITTDMIDFENSSFVGDAAGRPDDFSDNDKKFAENAGLKFYTPEEYYNI